MGTGRIFSSTTGSFSETLAFLISRCDRRKNDNRGWTSFRCSSTSLQLPKSGSLHEPVAEMVIQDFPINSMLGTNSISTLTSLVLALKEKHLNKYQTNKYGVLISYLKALAETIQVPSVGFRKSWLQKILQASI